MISMILNLTQHKATPEQIAQGVVDASPEAQLFIAELLTFDEIPSKEDITARAEDLAEFAAMYDLSQDDNSDGVYPSSAMIGGAPFLMSALEKELTNRGVTPLYAFSKRESVEKLENGKVVKTNVFKHIGLVKACK